MRCRVQLARERALQHWDGRAEGAYVNGKWDGDASSEGRKEHLKDALTDGITGPCCFFFLSFFLGVGGRQFVAAALFSSFCNLPFLLPYFIFKLGVFNFHSPVLLLPVCSKMCPTRMDCAGRP